MRVLVNNKTINRFDNQYEIKLEKDPDQFKILYLGYADLCEIGYHISRYINSYTNHGMWCASYLSNNYLHMRRHCTIANDVDIENLCYKMRFFNIVHINEYHNFPMLRHIVPYEHKVIIHHHGMEYRKKWKELEPEEINAGYLRIISTLDLREFSQFPQTLHWLPNPIDVNELRSMFLPRNDHVSRPLRISHAVTVRRNKATNTFISACDRLRQKGLQFDLDIIENCNHWESLWRISRCDIYLATLLYDIGTASYEAMAFGIPVVSGVSDFALQEWKSFMDGKPLPFVYCTEQTLQNRIEELLVDRQLRAYHGILGYEYVKKVHDYKNVGKLALNLYKITQPCKRVVRK